MLVMDIKTLAGLIVIVPVVLGLYLAPALVAMKRDHHQAAPIFVINLFLGWTLIGWILALAWSVSWIRPR